MISFLELLFLAVNRITRRIGLYEQIFQPRDFNDLGSVVLLSLFVNLFAIFLNVVHHLLIRFNNGIIYDL